MNKLNLKNKILIIITKFKENDFNSVIKTSNFLLREFKNNDFLWTLKGLSYLNLNNDLSERPHIVEKPNNTNMKISAGPNLIANCEIKHNIRFSLEVL